MIGSDQGRVVLTGEEAPPRRHASRAWSRGLFVVACAASLAVATAGAAARWDGLVASLARAPVPRAEMVAPASGLPAPDPGEQAVAEARSRIEAGDTAGALAALDRVSPEQPAYPFARRLRRHVESLGASRPRK